MRVAVLSGKGGAGKTLVSVNLACAANADTYLDCDVEEPNAHLFLRPRILAEKQIFVKAPRVDANRCTGCRVCVDFCRFNALALIRGKPLVFYEVCHSCGGCSLFCPEKAITEVDRRVGVVEEGKTGGLRVFTGRLDMGEISGVPIIKALLEHLPEQGLCILDCPPGSGCAVMESIREADFCLLVAEPTRFGVHNLAMVHTLVKLFKKPLGVVINKWQPGSTDPAHAFCTENDVPILATIPFDEVLGKLNSEGKIAVQEIPAYRELFETLAATLQKGASAL